MGGKKVLYSERFHLGASGKNHLVKRGRWKYTESLEKAEAKDINLVGIFEG